MLEDGRGSFWFSCSQGLFRVSQDDLTALADGRRKAVWSEASGVKDGLRTTAFGAGLQPNACRTADGKLLFCSLKGLVVVDPERLFKSTHVPPVYIEHVRFDRRGVPVDRPAVFPPSSGELKIEYTALGLRAPDRIRFRHRLEGFDADWVEAGTRRFAHYASLPAGSYRFRVMACNEDGGWNEAGAAFSFTLTPYFYRRGWFYAVCVFVLAGVTVAGHKVRVARLKASERELKRRVDEALAKVKVLRGLLPVCASCKKVRDDKGYWNQIETYLHEHSDTQISHGICPDCVRKLYPEYADAILRGESTAQETTAETPRKD